jgi:hypothetical protein
MILLHPVPDTPHSLNISTELTQLFSQVGYLNVNGTVGNNVMPLSQFID